MKPFNLELAKKGHPICTRDGRPARIVCFDMKNQGNRYPILALIEGKVCEIPITYKENGKCDEHDLENCHDLFMLGEKKTGWINIYVGPDGNFMPSSTIYEDEHEAEEGAFGSPTKVDTIQIEFEV